MVMIPSTNEFHRQRHEEHVTRLRSEMHRHRSSFSARNTLGAWLVAAGLRLAPDEKLHRRLLDLRDTPETDRVSGCVSA
jgi:hypothetical protein